jgi:hypothetical protein
MTSLTLMDMPPEVRSLSIERLFDGITIYIDVPGCVQKEGRARRDRFHKGPPSPAEGARCEKKQRRVVVSSNNVRKRTPRRAEKSRCEKEPWPRSKETNRLALRETNKHLNIEVLQYVSQRGQTPIFCRELSSINDSPEQSCDFFRHIQVLEINADDIVCFVHSMRTYFHDLRKLSVDLICDADDEDVTKIPG